MNVSLMPPSIFRVDAAKITAYLLNPHHPVGGSKALYFMSWGFLVNRPNELADALLNHPQTGRLVGALHNGFVDQFVYEGALIGPRSTIPRIRSVWKVDPGDTVGLLVTAYPY